MFTIFVGMLLPGLISPRAGRQDRGRVVGRCWVTRRDVVRVEGVDISLELKNCIAVFILCTKILPDFINISTSTIHMY